VFAHAFGAKGVTSNAHDWSSIQKHEPPRQIAPLIFVIAANKMRNPFRQKNTHHDYYRAE
jgi:hypothetical protein